jgi:DNA processing protein
MGSKDTLKPKMSKNMFEGMLEGAALMATRLSPSQWSGCRSTPLDTELGVNQKGVALLSALPRQPALAIVGSRAGDPYGLNITEMLAKGAALSGVLTLSGGAHGVDMTAHQASLEAGGESLAILGVGLYNTPNRLRSMIERGLGVMSPFRETQRGARWTYPRRNAWIAELAGAVIVVQAGPRSGALITAREALARGRPTWIVPGPFNHPLHSGLYPLLDEGARVLTSPDQWRTHPPWNALQEGDLTQLDHPRDTDHSKRAHPHGLGVSAPDRRDEQEYPKSPLWSASSTQPKPLSELAYCADMHISDAMVEATLLELDGWLTAYPGGRYTRAYRR